MNNPEKYRAPWVNVPQRLVLIYSPGLGAWVLNKVTTAGQLAMNHTTLAAFEAEPQKAARKMGYGFARFRAVRGLSGCKFASHADQVAVTWAAAVEQTPAPTTPPTP